MSTTALESKHYDRVGTAEAARILGVSQRTVTDLALQRRIPGAFRVGDKIVFERSTLEAFCDSGGHLPATHKD